MIKVCGGACLLKSVPYRQTLAVAVSGSRLQSLQAGLVELFDPADYGMAGAGGQRFLGQFQWIF